MINGYIISLLFLHSIGVGPHKNVYFSFEAYNTNFPSFIFSQNLERRSSLEYFLGKKVYDYISSINNLVWNIYWSVTRTGRTQYDIPIFFYVFIISNQMLNKNKYFVAPYERVFLKSFGKTWLRSFSPCFLFDLHFRSSGPDVCNFSWSPFWPRFYPIISNTMF